MIRRAALPVLALALIAAGRHRPLTVFDLTERVGKPVPAITLATAAGAPLRLDAPTGKPAFVFLFASWCEPCHQALPLIRADYARYGDRVRFIAVDVYEDDAAARTTLANAAFPFESAIFTTAALDAMVTPDEQLRTGAYRIPAEVLIGADGIVRGAWRGIPVGPDGTLIDPLPPALAAIGVH